VEHYEHKTHGHDKEEENLKENCGSKSLLKESWESLAQSVARNYGGIRGDDKGSHIKWNGYYKKGHMPTKNA